MVVVKVEQPEVIVDHRDEKEYSKLVIDNKLVSTAVNTPTLDENIEMIPYEDLSDPEKSSKRVI